MATERGAEKKGGGGREIGGGEGGMCGGELWYGERGERSAGPTSH